VSLSTTLAESLSSLSSSAGHFLRFQIKVKVLIDLWLWLNISMLSANFHDTVKFPV
jgi:hypothetical protein